MDSLSQRPVEAEKCCTKCGEAKATTEFYFNKSTNRYRNICKRCHNVHVAAHARANPETRRASRAAFDERNPGVRRAQYIASNVKRAEHRRDYNHAYKATHAEEIKAYNAATSAANVARAKAWQAANRAHVNQQQRERRAQNIEVAREQERARRAANPNRLVTHALYREENREAINERHRAWTAANRHKTHVHVRNRRARLAGAVGTFTLLEWQAIKQQQAYTCLMCGQVEPHIKLTIDHIVPVSKGGANSSDNIQGLCAPCNSRKGARL